MKRRDFLKTASAAASVPFVPALPSHGAPIGAAQYAKAAHIAKNGAFLSATYLKFALGLDDGTSERLVRRLQADGLVGASGKNGLMFSKVFFSEHAKIVSRVAVANKPLLKEELLDAVLEEPEPEEIAQEDMPEAEEPYTLIQAQ